MPSGTVDPADGIVVFHAGGSLEGLDNESLRRIERTIKLYKSHPVEKIFCAGGARPSEKYYGCQMAGQALIEGGVPREAVFYDMHSNDTISNLKEALAWIAGKGWQRIYFVSDSMHLLRIRYLLKDFSDAPEIIYVPYNYGKITKLADALHIWYRVHYEWLAWAVSSVLPASVYRQALDIIRAPYNR